MRRHLPPVIALFCFLGGAATAPTQPFETRDPVAVHAQLTQPPLPIPAIAWNEVRRDSNTIEFRATFPSAFHTDTPENQTVPVWLYLPANAQYAAPFPVVVTLHYLGAGDISAERALGRQLNARGVAALALALPYHLSRAPEGTRSGELAIQPDPSRIVDVMVQSVLDVRRALDQLALRTDIDAKNFGISGISLGSLVAELAYGVDPRLSHSAFLLGGTGLAHILWSSSLVIVSREGLRRRRLNEAALAKLLSPIEPGPFLRARLAAGTAPPGANLVVGAAFDTVMPPIATKNLIADLNAPKVLWMDTGHYGGIFVQRRLLGEVATFFSAEFKGEPYTPPASIHAPTLRLIAQAATPTGFDIGVGIDIFKTRERLETFGCAALTPHGPELFVAKSIGGGFAVGGGVGFKGPGFGVYWSAVL
ncbi:MAG: alpha/beta hydrolase family protein [Fimbriimonadaceae bacterium]